MPEYLRFCKDSMKNSHLTAGDIEGTGLKTNSPKRGSVYPRSQRSGDLRLLCAIMPGCWG